MKSSEKITLLIVDDDHDILDLLVEGAVNLEISKKIGEIHSASSVKKALAIMKKNEIDVIFSDLRMPDEDGISFLKKAKEKDPSIIFIMMTGYSDLSSAIKAVREHAFDYIEKPIVSDIFEKTIVKAIRKKEMDVMIDRARIQSLENEKIASLGIMSASIAKEISSPLLQIKKICDDQIESITSKKELDIEEAKLIYKKIYELSDEINNITKSLINLSSEQSNDKVTVPIRFIIDDAINVCSYKFNSKDIKLTYTEVSETLLILCNRIEISQAFICIIDNACDAIESLPERWIDLCIENNSKEVQIIITDSGSGIPKDIAKKIFNDFFTTKPVGVGTGFGLNLAKQTIENHRGKLELDRKSRNTCFKISLPLAAN